ncbi:MAG: hypothetical protein O6826_10500 [Acidobacteria bacterium]|nr:hypothetical protein [Acidobacteriota bacterium]MCZ6769967.1 hypothetical protein [Acidobacteriota bacterium]MCZ6877202.1 hypothetical protein [Acidobacteriota bacterium]
MDTTGLERTLEAIVNETERLKEVRKAELNQGDWVLVTTLNSTYSIRVLEEDLYSISGGWFDREGLSPLRTSITGCTWGGSAIKVDIVAACGLHLEFGNRVVTSPIQNVCVMRLGGEHLNN